MRQQKKVCEFLDRSQQGADRERFSKDPPSKRPAWHLSVAGRRLAARFDQQAVAGLRKPIRLTRTPPPLAPVRAPATLPADWSRQAEHFVRALAPLDFAGLPVYVVRNCELPPEWGWHTRHVRGVVSGLMSEAARPAIGDRWRGIGPTIFVNERYGPADEIELHTWATSTLIHEASHCLEPALMQYFHAPKFEHTEDYIAAHRDSIGTPEPTNEPLPSDDHLHAADFLRTCAHLTHRAKQLVSLLNLKSDFGHVRLIDAERVADRPGVCWLSECFASEASAHESTPISEILKLPMPPRFELLERQRLAFLSR